MISSILYTSFLLRFWKQGTDESVSGDYWHIDLEHIQTGRKFTFETLAALQKFLADDLQQRTSPEARIDLMELQN